MKVGVTFWFQNYTDFKDRVVPADYSKPQTRPDSVRFMEEFHLADLIEPLGFDSLWTIEHHFGPYSMTCNPLQLLSYMAGRTSRIEMGTMVVVLPWHDPLHVAEEMAILDNLLQGRKLKIGVGRGAAVREFLPIRVDYDSSRQRLSESLEIVRRALTTEFFSFSGDFFDIPEVSIRPRPITPDLTEHMLMGWSSSVTLELAATEGMAPLFANFKGWDTVASELVTYNDIRAKYDWEPSAATVAVTVYCARDAEEAQRTGSLHWRHASDAGIWHYDKMSWESFADLDPQERAAFLEAGYERQIAMGLFGTPEDLVQRLTTLQKEVNIGELICLFSFGDIPRGHAEASMRLFAEEVLPALQAIDAPAVRATPYEAVRSARTELI